jgi:hypothetical protein
MTTEYKLLIAASKFIRSQPNGADGTIKELMADAVAEAAARVNGGYLTPEIQHQELRRVPPPPVVPVHAPRAPKLPAPEVIKVSGVSDDNMRILLRAAGYGVVKKPVLACYRALLSDQGRSWTTTEVGKATGLGNNVVNGVCARMWKRKVLVKVGHAQYRAT